jgi:hypothetical protein
MLNRRTFLKGLGAAAAFAATGLGKGIARARVPVSPVAILVLDFKGGWDVHATFAGRTNPNVNPFGVYEDTDTGAMRLSKCLFRNRDALVKRDSAAWGRRIPGIEDMAKHLSVVGALRHATSFDVDDHVQTARFMGRGYLSRLDAPGIGAVIGKHVRAESLAPPGIVLQVGNASGEMAYAPGDFLPYAPLLTGPDVLPLGDGTAIAGSALQRAIDGPARDRRQALARGKIDRLRAASEALVKYRPFFVDPAVHTGVSKFGAARLEAGLLGAKSPTNAQLIDALGGEMSIDSAAVALGIRCIEGGSRFVAVGIGQHDSHEKEDFDVYVKDAQYLAGTLFVLEELGLADKVLVVALSEMARSPYEGFYNDGGGTDHGPVGLVTPKGLRGSNRQSVFLAGGPIKGGREVYPADAEWGDPVGTSCISAELLAFLAECAGVEREDHTWNESPDGVPLDADALHRGLVA